MDLRPFLDEESTKELQPAKPHKDAKCAMDLRPFNDEENRDEERMEADGGKV